MINVPSFYVYDFILQIRVWGMFADLQIGVYRGGSLRKIGQEECLKQRKIMI